MERGQPTLASRCKAVPDEHLGGRLRRAELPDRVIRILLRFWQRIASKLACRIKQRIAFCHCRAPSRRRSGRKNPRKVKRAGVRRVGLAFCSPGTRSPGNRTTVNSTQAFRSFSDSVFRPGGAKKQSENYDEKRRMRIAKSRYPKLRSASAL